jgi:hypothetical protein
MVEDDWYPRNVGSITQMNTNTRGDSEHGFRLEDLSAGAIGLNAFYFRVGRASLQRRWVEKVG